MGNVKKFVRLHSKKNSQVNHGKNMSNIRRSTSNGDVPSITRVKDLTSVHPTLLYSRETPKLAVMRVEKQVTHSSDLDVLCPITKSIVNVTATNGFRTRMSKIRTATRSLVVAVK